VESCRTRYLAEHRADAATVWGLRVLAAELLPIVLGVPGHLVGVIGFEPIVDHFQHAASEFAQPVLKGVLELPRRFWSDGLQQKIPHELVNLLPLRLGDGSRFFPDAFEILGNQAYQKNENRLRSCIEASFPGYVFVVVVQTRVFLQKTPLFCESNFNQHPPLNRQTAKKQPLLPVTQRLARLHPIGWWCRRAVCHWSRILLQVSPQQLDNLFGSVKLIWFGFVRRVKDMVPNMPFQNFGHQTVHGSSAGCNRH